MRGWLLAIVLGSALVVTHATEARARVLLVDDDGAQCPDAAFTSIQAAVDAAASEDTVQVCAGVYEEQITVGAGKDGLRLEAKHPLAAIIQAPRSMGDRGDIVRITNARDVVLRGFVVSGPLPNRVFCTHLAGAGIRVDGHASAVIERNLVTEILSTTGAYRDCPNGFGILVGRHAEGEVGTATIRDNTIDFYQKGGILIDHAGSFADVRDNWVAGAGAPESTVANGIQVSHGAAAEIRRNVVSGNVYQHAPVGGGVGILLSQPQPGGVRIEQNQIVGNDDGIALLATTGAQVLRNISYDNLTLDGIFVDDQSTDNRIEDNAMWGNGQYDCHDSSAGGGSAATANLWRRNRGTTESVDALCAKP